MIVVVPRSKTVADVVNRNQHIEKDLEGKKPAPAVKKATKYSLKPKKPIAVPKTSKNNKNSSANENFNLPADDEHLVKETKALNAKSKENISAANDDHKPLSDSERATKGKTSVKSPIKASFKTATKADPKKRKPASTALGRSLRSQRPAAIKASQQLIGADVTDNESEEVEKLTRTKIRKSDHVNDCVQEVSLDSVSGGEALYAARPKQVVKEALKDISPRVKSTLKSGSLDLLRGSPTQGPALRTTEELKFEVMAIAKAKKLAPRASKGGTETEGDMASKLSNMLEDLDDPIESNSLQVLGPEVVTNISQNAKAAAHMMTTKDVDVLEQQLGGFTVVESAPLAENIARQPVTSYAVIEVEAVTKRKETPIHEMSLKRPRVGKNGNGHISSETSVGVTDKLLVDENLARKQPIISFGTMGARNQGISRSVKHTTKSLQVEPVEYLSPLAARKRTRLDVNDARPEDGHPAKRRSVSPNNNQYGEMNIFGDQDMNLGKNQAVAGDQDDQIIGVTDQLMACTSSPRKEPHSILPVKSRISQRSRSKLSRHTSQLSRVDSNGSPIASKQFQVDHIGIANRKLLEGPPDPSPIPEVGQSLEETRSLEIFGPKVYLGSMAKARPMSPEAVTNHYVPHRKTGTGLYEGVATKDVRFLEIVSP
jgi:hypothetical protein